MEAYLPDADDRKQVITEFFATSGQQFLPILELLMDAKEQLHAFTHAVGVAAIEGLLELSATQIAGPPHPGKAHIDQAIIEQNEGLLQGSSWGAVKLCHDPADGGIRIVDFKPMQAGRISVDSFFECRKAFEVEEWMALLIRTMGYEPERYSEKEQIWLLCRLIPVVHNRVNMMELAPPGSGKSFVYNNISRHVWLTAAEISPAVLFYNRARRSAGLLTRYDLVVLDEAQSIRFTNEAEIQAQLKGYLEQGVYSRGDVTATAECGMMLLANIDLQKTANGSYHNGEQKFQPAKSDYVRRLSSVFLESPLLDRFHGIIPGWEIPPFRTDQQATGFGLKADYFAEVCHALRGVSHISQSIRAKLSAAV